MFGRTFKKLSLYKNYEATLENNLLVLAQMAIAKLENLKASNPVIEIANLKSGLSYQLVKKGRSANFEVRLLGIFVASFELAYWQGSWSMDSAKKTESDLKVFFKETAEKAALGIGNL